MGWYRCVCVGGVLQGPAPRSRLLEWYGFQQRGAGAGRKAGQYCIYCRLPSPQVTPRGFFFLSLPYQPQFEELSPRDLE